MIAARCSTTHAAVAARPARASAVVCRATEAATSSRRALLLASVGVAFAAAAAPARALIPDEEDTEMLEKAKANRRQRLAAQRETTREFLSSEGLENRQLEQELVPVQRLVLDLAKSGAFVRCWGCAAAGCACAACNRIRQGPAAGAIGVRVFLGGVAAFVAGGRPAERAGGGARAPFRHSHLKHTRPRHPPPPPTTTTGAQLDAGDVKGVAATLQRGGGLVSDFERAADAIGGPGKEQAAGVAAGVRALREAADRGDATGSRREYVALVGALQGWADASGVKAAIKGL